VGDIQVRDGAIYLLGLSRSSTFPEAV